MTTETVHSKFLEIMVDDILGKLEGSHQLFERLEIPDKPSKIIVLGTLGDISTDYSPQIQDHERTLSSVKNNSLAVKFLTDKDNGKIGIIPTFSLYYRVYPTFQEQTNYINKIYDTLPENVDIAKIWKRKDVTINELIFKTSVETNEKYINFQNTIQLLLNDEEIFTEGKEIPSSSINDEKSYFTEIDALKSNRKPSFNWKAKIQIKKDFFPQDGTQLKLLTIHFINETEESKSYETFLFNCNLQINLHELDIQPFKHRYEYEGFEHHYETFLRCLNCHATYNEQNDMISTHHYSKFSQKKLIPRTTINGITFNFEDLSTVDGLKSLNGLRTIIEERINSWKADPSYSNDPKYIKNLDHLHELKDRF